MLVNARDRDPGIGQFHAQGFSNCHLGGLGSGIDANERSPSSRGGRGDDHDLPAPTGRQLLPLHLWHGEADTFGRADHIDVEHLPHLGRVGLINALVAAVAGIADKRIEAAKLRDRFADQPLAVDGVSNIAANHDERAKLTVQLVQAILTPGGQCQPGTGGMELACQFHADARAGSGDNHHHVS